MGDGQSMQIFLFHNTHLYPFQSKTRYSVWRVQLTSASLFPWSSQCWRDRHMNTGSMMVGTKAMLWPLSRRLTQLLSLQSVQPASSQNNIEYSERRNRMWKNASGEQPATGWQVGCTGLPPPKSAAVCPFQNLHLLSEGCLSCPKCLLQ